MASAPLKFRGTHAWLNEDNPVCLHGQRVSQPDGGGHLPPGRRAGGADYQVLSAGLGAAEGQPPSPYAVQAVKELGIDISGLRSRMLTPELVQQADYIFGMTHSHVDTVMLLLSAGGGEDLPAARVRRDARLVREGHQRPDWRLLRGLSQLPGPDRAGDRLAAALRREGRGVPGGPAAVAIGADHGGYELKEALKQHLEAQGVSVVDFGAQSPRAQRLSRFRAGGGARASRRAARNSAC